MKDYKTDKGVIRTTPFGNTLTLQFAKAALVNYELGKGAETDFLAINLASTDYVGHSYGPNSIEVEDTYIRLDRDLAVFFKELDNKVGKDNYVVFLSADHGGAHSAGYLDSNKMPSGFFDENLQQSLEEELKARFKTEKIILGIDNYQIYLNDEAIIKNRLNQEDVKMNIINKLNKKPEILYAFELAKVALLPVPEPLKSRAISGFNWKRSGDIQIVPKDGMLPNYARKGTTHGAWNSYDSHIPLIFMGWKIKAGENNAAYYMTDIAPTISALLHIQYPSGMVGRPITEVLESK